MLPVDAIQLYLSTFEDTISTYNCPWTAPWRNYLEMQTQTPQALAARGGTAIGIFQVHNKTTSYPSLMR
jgi:hypothetical protein